MTASRDHDADHVAIRELCDEWDFDPEMQSDILRDVLILHLGAFHGWTVAARKDALGLIPMIVVHDGDHESTDVLGIEASLDDPVIRDEIDEERARTEDPSSFKPFCES